MYPESLMTRETVIVETPARRATSLRVLTSSNIALRGGPAQTAPGALFSESPIRGSGSVLITLTCAAFRAC
jgi:hypothetical protein